MSHRKKLSEGKLQIQYLMITTREITSNLSIRFSGHFIKSTEFDQNFKTHTVSLRTIFNENWRFNFGQYIA